MKIWEKIIRYRSIIIIVAIAITFILSFPILKLKRDASLSTLVPENHPDFVYSKKIESTFGAKEFVIIEISTKDSIYNPSVINLIREYTDYLKTLKYTQGYEVLSITSADDIQGDNNELVILPLIDKNTVLDKQALIKIRKKIETNPLYHGRLVSLDGKNTIIVVDVLLETYLSDIEGRDLINKIHSKAKKLGQKYRGTEIYISGLPIVSTTISSYMAQDLKNLFPIALTVVIFFMIFVLHSAFAMVAPVVVVLFGIIWVLGIKSLLNSPITIIETGIPVMLVAIGCADGIHIMHDFLGIKRKGFSSERSARMAIHRLAVPIINTSVTTAIGVLSFISSPSTSLRNIGLFVAMGVMLEMMFSLLLIPAYASFYKDRTEKKDKKALSRRLGDAMDNVMQWLAIVIVKRRLFIIGIAIITIIISVFSVARIKVEANEIKYFKKNDPIRLVAEKIKKDFGGISNLGIIIEGSDLDTIKRPKVMQYIWDLQLFCETQDIVSHSVSIADYVRRINYVLHDNDPMYDRVPYEEEEITSIRSDGLKIREKVKGRDQIAQFLLLYEMTGGKIESMVDGDYQIARIMLRLKDDGTIVLEELVQSINKYIAGNKLQNISIRYTNRYLLLTVARIIPRSVFISAIITVIAVFLWLSLVYKSYLVSLLMIITAFTPLMFNYTVMLIFGETLNIGTAIITALNIGIGIDFTIHFFACFKRNFWVTKKYSISVVRAVKSMYRVLFKNAFVVGLGFMVL
ncbi:RND family transporter, partial [Elusimicrobiota bacterium]